MDIMIKKVKSVTHRIREALIGDYDLWQQLFNR